MTFNPSNTLGPFLPINQTYSQDAEQFLLQITSRDRDIARFINIREIAIYDLVQVPTGEQWFNNSNPQLKRDGFRSVYSIGAINTGATLNTAHGLSGVTAYTHIYGTAITDAPDNRPIPYSSATAVNQQIEIKVNGTNIVIINGAGGPNITSAIVVLEYLKS